MPVFELRQIEPHRPGAPLRVLVLKGSAAPVGELVTPVSMRNSLTWVSASNKGSARLDGAEYGEIPASFVWRSEQLARSDDARLSFIDPNGSRGSETALTRWEAISEVAALFAEEPALCRLTFEDREWVGFVAEVAPTALRAGHGRCEIVFQPIERGIPKQRGFEAPFDPQRFSRDISAMFEDGVETSSAARLKTFSGREMDAVDTAIEDVRTAIADIQTQAESINNPARTVKAVQSGVAFAVAGLTSAATALVEAAVSPAEQLAQTDDYVAQIKARISRTSIRASTLRMKHEASRARRQIDTAGDSIGSYTTLGPETLWAISFVWFGTTAYADAIGRRNGIVGPFVDGGVKLTIPKRPL